MLVTSITNGAFARVARTIGVGVAAGAALAELAAVGVEVSHAMEVGLDVLAGR